MITRGVLAVAVLATVLTMACSSDGDDDDDTLAPIGSAADGSTITVGTVGGATAPAGTAVDPAEAGTGYVGISVRRPGVDETISLDRATVRAADLDPVSLHAACTGLDGGTALEVAVVDLRRLGSGAQLVAATLRAPDDVTGGGDFEGTLDVVGVDQVTTTYEGQVSVLAGALGGGFTATDAAGNTATGSFECAPMAPAAPPSSALPGTGGEETPDTTG